MSFKELELLYIIRDDDREWKKNNKMAEA